MQVALVTGTGPDFVSEVDGPLTAALRRRGAAVHLPRWDDASVDWSRFDLALVRTTWDYTARRDDFVAWAAAAASCTQLWNSADVLRWNTHKSYLLELEERGAPVVPTAWLGQDDRVDLAALLSIRSWDRAVIKPAVAAGSEGLARVRVVPGPPPGSPQDPPPGPTGELDIVAGQRHLDRLLAAGDVLVQPFLPAIERSGELSLIVVDGQVTHAVRKQPGPGDFRVQEGFGGSMQVVDPDPTARELARWIVQATGGELIVSRVDLVVDEVGTWQLVELEATEPDLYLRVAPAAAEPLADAVLRRLPLTPAART